MKIIDIDEKQHQDKWQIYTFDVPVVHLNDKMVMMHRVDEKKLEDAMKTESKK